jgi:hypothetical protein
MFEAYKVATTLSITNKVSSVLGVIASEFAATDRAALKLKTTLTKLTAAQMGLAGAMIGGVGFLGLKLIAGAVKPAEDYARQLNNMNMAGMQQVQIAESIQAAWKNTSDVMTTTATGNLKTILDLRNVIGADKGLGEVKELLPIVSKIQAVMAASSDKRLSSHGEEIGFAMAKALDMIGAVNNPVELEKQASMMSKAITATQGRVTPQMYQSVFQYARQAKFDLSDEFKYEILPSLMLEAAGKGGGGGGSRGVGPMLAAMYRVTNQGYINKKAMSEWQKLGYVDGSTALKTTTEGTTVGAMKDSQGAASNPFVWVNSLVDAIKKKYGADVSDQFIRQELNGLFRGNQLAASAAVEFFTKQQNFLRDQKIIKSALPYNDAYISIMANDPKTAMDALGMQWENLKTAIGITVVPILIPALRGLTSALNSLGTFLHRHPTMTKALTLTFTALSGLAVVGGGLLIVGAALKLIAPALTVMSGLNLTGAATGLGALASALGPVVAIAIAVANSDKIGALISGTWADKYNPFLATQRGTEALTHWLKGDPQGSSGSWAPPSSGNPIQVQTQINLDGKQVATVVTNHQYNAANSPASSGSGFDGRQSYIQSGTSGSW